MFISDDSSIRHRAHLSEHKKNMVHISYVTNRYNVRGTYAGGGEIVIFISVRISIKEIQKFSKTSKPLLKSP